MAHKEHAQLMKEYRDIRKRLGMVEFRAYLTPEEHKLFKQMYAGVLLQRKLNGLDKVYPS